MVFDGVMTEKGGNCSVVSFVLPAGLRGIGGGLLASDAEYVTD